MTPDEFEIQLKRDGYLDIRHRDLIGGHDTVPHQHDFDTRLLILDGELTVVVEHGEARTAGAGAILDIPAGTPHREVYTPGPLRFIAGLRHAAES